MPNMDYPGPCASCISDNCEAWEENYSQHDFTEERREYDKKRKLEEKK